MRRLHPDAAGSADPVAAVTADERPAPEGRPWVLANMVTSIDGATAVAGRSGALGGPGDKVLFAALRSVADVILVGAGTARAEGYRRPRTADDQRGARAGRGQSEHPRLAVVSGRLDLDAGAAFLEGDPVVITHASSDAARRATLGAVAEVIVAGDADVDLAVAVAALHERGARTVLCEGGPRLLGSLAADDLIDELCLTVSCRIVGGDAHRIVETDADLDHRFALARVLEEDGDLFLRYVRVR